METMIRVRIYAHGEVSFSKFLFLPSWSANCWRSIFLILPKLDDVKLIWQTVGVALYLLPRFSS
jgi:hypothetical protein